MSVEFTKDYEAKRVENEQKKRESRSWDLFNTNSLVKAVRFAKENGWAENKVQVREERHTDYSTYYVEPFESNCGCKGILRYSDFYGLPAPSK